MKAIEKKKLFLMRKAVLKANKFAKKVTDPRREYYRDKDVEYMKIVKRNNQVFRKAMFMVPSLAPIAMYRLFMQLNKERMLDPEWGVWWHASTYTHKLIVAMMLNRDEAIALDEEHSVRNRANWEEHLRANAAEEDHSGTYKVICELSTEAEAERQELIKEQA